MIRSKVAHCTQGAVGPTESEVSVRDELVQVIRERTGLDEAMAQQVATVAIDFLKEKLPPQVAPLLDGQISGIPDVGGLLGGMFGERGE
jgi:hypothetical protein